MCANTQYILFFIHKHNPWLALCTEIVHFVPHTRYARFWCHLNVQSPLGFWSIAWSRQAPGGCRLPAIAFCGHVDHPVNWRPSPRPSSFVPRGPLPQPTLLLTSHVCCYQRHPLVLQSSGDSAAFPLQAQTHWILPLSSVIYKSLTWLPGWYSEHSAAAEAGWAGTFSFGV